MDCKKEEVRITTNNITLTDKELEVLKNILENKVERYSLYPNEEGFICDFLAMFDEE